MEHQKTLVENSVSTEELNSRDVIHLESKIITSMGTWANVKETSNSFRIMTMMITFFFISTFSLTIDHAYKHTVEKFRDTSDFRVYLSIPRNL